MHPQNKPLGRFSLHRENEVIWEVLHVRISSSHTSSPFYVCLVSASSMWVLLLGLSGRVDSQFFPALLAHQRFVVAYLRNPAIVSDEVAKRVSAIAEGCATE